MSSIGSLLTVGVIFYWILNVSGLPIDHEPIYNNGSHLFAPTVLFVSLDGVVNHDLDLFITPVLTQMGIIF